jgi:3-phosphoshikimate 1-carboxyvinyltransferase
MTDQPFSYPECLEITPLSRPPVAAVAVPGSKSLTNRALILAALMSEQHPCRLRGVLRSEDTEVLFVALKQLGYQLTAYWEETPPQIVVGPQSGAGPRPRPAELYLANSGTSMRFLAALASLGQGRFRLDGTPRMRQRPIDDLLAALRQVGVPAWSEQGTGCPPVILEGRGGWQGTHLRVRGAVSSQFLSGLLLVAPFACRDASGVRLEIEGNLVSQPYVAMTVSLLRRWGLSLVEEAGAFVVAPAPPPAARRPPAEYLIEPDASAASYFWAAAALTGGRVTVLDLPEDSLQGDVRFVELLARMGCRVERCSAGITVHGRPLTGIDADLNGISDTVMTLAAVACFAQGPTTIRNVAHIRYKESDRLAALAQELRKLGPRVEEHADGLTIWPAPLHGATLETYDDHRLAMSLSLIGLRVPGVRIRNPACVAKTYPAFFQDLEQLRC